MPSCDKCLAVGHLHVGVVNEGVEEVGCLSKQRVRLPGDRGHLKRKEQLLQIQIQEQIQIQIQIQIQNLTDASMPMPSLRAGSSSGFGGADTCFKLNSSELKNFPENYF